MKRRVLLSIVGLVFIAGSAVGFCMSIPSYVCVGLVVVGCLMFAVGFKAVENRLREEGK